MPDVRSVLAIVGGALVAAALVFVWQTGRPDVFESEALLSVDAPSILSTSGGRPEDAVFLARTYAVRAHTRPVLEDAASVSGRVTTPELVRQRTSVAVSDADATITVRATGTSPDSAQELAAALTDALRANVRTEQEAAREERLEPLNAQIAALEESLGGTPPGSPQRLVAERQYEALVAQRASVQVEPFDRLNVLSAPQRPSASTSPRPFRDAAITFIIAAVIGAEALIGCRLLRRDRAAGSQGAA